MNAPELNSPDPAVRAAASEARDLLAQLLPAGTEFILTASGLEKYGRLLAKVARASDSVDVGAELLAQGKAVPI